MKVTHIVNSVGLGGTEAWLSRVLPLSRHQHTVNPLRSPGSLDFGPVLERGGTTVATIKRFPRLVDADVVHVHLHYDALPHILSARLSGAAVIWHAHTDTRILDASQPVLRRVRRRAMSRCGSRACRSLLACSADAAIAQFGRTSDVAVVPLAVPRAIKRGGPRWAPGEQLRLAFFGRLERRKRPDILVDVVAVLLQEDVDAVVDLYGGGPMAALLRDRATSRGVESRIRFRGGVLDPQSAMSKAHVVVVPSTFEGFGLVPVEAAAAGVPFVASSAVQSASDLDGPIRIVPTDSPADAWASEVLEVAASRQSFGGRTEAVLDLLAPTRSAQVIDAIYDSLGAA